jgi:hypothetical protein
MVCFLGRSVFCRLGLRRAPATFGAAETQIETNLETNHWIRPDKQLSPNNPKTCVRGFLVVRVSARATAGAKVPGSMAPSATAGAALPGSTS